VVRQGVNGLLVPPRDAPALAEAIARLLDDPLLRGEMGRQSRRLATELFDEERIVAETLSLYRRLLAEKGLHLGA
jgi:glycosyltransferase involved in cell wall biosynthesis